MIPTRPFRNHSLYSPAKGEPVPRPARSIVLSKKEIGERIRALRSQRALSQVELADALGTYQTVISAVERGVRGLSLQQVVRLAKTLKVSPDAILGQGRPEEGPVKDRRFAKRLQQIDRLSKRQKQALLVTLDNFLKGAGVS
jgi:transcriptional regulator with XRE-family HTH domain